MFGSQGVTVGVNQSSQSTCSKIACSKWSVGVGMITAVAIATLGALALVGLFYPTSPLGVIGGTFGQIGTYATLAAGCFLGVSILLARFCACSNKGTTSLWRDNGRRGSTDLEVNFGDSTVTTQGTSRGNGASTAGARRDTVSFS